MFCLPPWVTEQPPAGMWEPMAGPSQPRGEGTVELLEGPKEFLGSRIPIGTLTQDLHLSCASAHG